MKKMPQEEIFRLAIETIEDAAICLLSPAGVIQTWNQGGERLYGYEANEITGKHFSAFYLAEDIQNHKPEEELKDALLGRGKNENWNCRKDGSKFWALTTITALRDAKGALLGFLQMTRDGSEKKQAGENRKSYEYLASAASHDLQEPLRAVSMYADILLSGTKEKLNPEEKEFLQYAVDGASRAQNLVRGLSDYARACLKGLEFKKTDMNLIFEKAFMQLRPQIEESEAEITSGRLPFVEADPFQMLQLVYSLWTFLLEHKDPRRSLQIHMSAKKGNHEWIFTVQSTGKGIAPDQQDALFGFSKKNWPEQKKSPATGLELALCRKIIERHHGEMKLGPSSEKNPVFIFTLSSLLPAV